MQKEQNLKLKSTLIHIGFSQKEVTVYLALLELGQGTVSLIARRAGINRTTGYDILDSLSQKGLVSISGKEPKQEYAAEPPEMIKKYLESEIQKKRDALATTETLYPSLLDS